MKPWPVAGASSVDRFLLHPARIMFERRVFSYGCMVEWDQPMSKQPHETQDVTCQTKHVRRAP